MIVHYPESEEAQAMLRRQVARIHAQSVLEYVGKLNCPVQQKRQLLGAVADAMRKRQES